MADQQEPTYEQAREELMAVVAQLESGGAPLADSMTLWQRGEKLAEICQRFLDGAKEQVARSRATADDGATEQP
ncbi:exodeoxyribonuclease VII small subunit [Tessaracoccus sp. HDW20]|uniref:exodeoxyribonuclease VII small subunit n=1 Tax=Tessaracoccus coleopterorum TaxID=2714950 RepID=UPI0018D439FE|nr:exodeoxyribonuclease VII small subunit [Tessaracoccus coleopterorum]NHB84304.1 exodeoxyribonuclease VII small subunit [Tessaracoccus coleopterorum]